MKKNSPFYGITCENEILRKRDELIIQYPLAMSQLIKYSLEAWEIIKNIEIDIFNQKFKFIDLNLHGSIYGGLIDTVLREVIIYHEKGKWEHPKQKKDKDVIFSSDNSKSLEIKSGGQEIPHVFGNRSSNLNEKKEYKSMDGYYITINYYNDEIYLIRFGWLDDEDWESQTDGGQQAYIVKDAYNYKLKVLYDSYILNTPIHLLYGVNLNKEVDELNNSHKELIKLGKIENLISYSGNDSNILKMKYTILFSKKVHLRQDTEINLLELLKISDCQIGLEHIKENILVESLNVKINDLKGISLSGMDNVSLVDFIRDNYKFKNLECNILDKAKKFIKESENLMLKKAYRPKKYGQPLLDLNMYRDYQGDNHILNLIKKFLKE